MSQNRYFPGSSVSRYLPTSGRSWDQAVFQSGKPVLDSEFNLAQEVLPSFQNLLLTESVPSGWVRGPGQAQNPEGEFIFPPVGNPAFAADAFYMRRQMALVDGVPLAIEFTGTPVLDRNLIQLSAAPLYGGAPPDVKRTDFVFLEVFRALVSTSPHATATVTVNSLPSAGDTLTVNGIVLTAVAGAPAVDQFTIGASVNSTAQNIATAINLGTNSFSLTATAQVDVTIPNQVNLRAVPAGAAGNLFTLASVEAVPGTFTLSGPFFAGGVNTGNKPSQSTIYRNGNVLAPAPVNLPDDIQDPIVGAETSKRVQVQYRIRTTGQAEAVNFKTENGFSNPNVLAQGTQVAPVATYVFVPANGIAVSGPSSAPAYGKYDAGLWVAGDGSQAAATALGTVDGFAYAIPIGFVFRRNDAYNGGAGAGFSPLSNTNGALPHLHGAFLNPEIGAVGVNASDRPDGRFYDVLVKGDLLDLRKQTFPAGIDLTEELNRQMQLLLDGKNSTWAIDGADKNTLGAGSGDVSSLFLVCNEVGRSAAEGGVAPSSGSTTRGDSIANFDHIRRRFSDRSIVERVTLALLPSDTSVAQPGKFVTQANAGYLGWAENDLLTLDMTALNATGLGSWSDATSTYTGGAGGGTVAGFWPPGTTITDVPRIVHDDGNYGVAVSKNVQMKLVVGVGTPRLDITLDKNVTQVNGGTPTPLHRMVGDAGLDDGSQRRIFVELEITYPIGAGTTDTVTEKVTPDPTSYAYGALVENDQTQRPLDWENLLAPVAESTRREVALEYVANDGSGVGSGSPITDTLVSDTNSLIFFPRRVYGSAALVGSPSVTDSVTAQPHDVNVGATFFGSSLQTVQVVTAGPNPAQLPLSGAGQTLVSVGYFAQDPIPNYGAVGYQLALYFRSQAPQTLGSQAGVTSLPAQTTVVPLAMSRQIWSSISSVGSVDTGFPYPNASDKIPVSSLVPGGDFPDEWVLSATANVSIADFSASTGMLTLNQMVQADGNSNFTFSSPAKDSEFRAHYRVSDPTAYKPTAMAQPLSGGAIHKAWFPFLAYATSDTVLWRKNEVLLLVVSRFFKFDSSNAVVFTGAPGEPTCVALYRTRGLLLVAAPQ
jgi:hypothetical protein